MSLGNTVCSYSVVTIHGAYIVSFSVESIVLLLLLLIHGGDNVNLISYIYSVHNHTIVPYITVIVY